MFLCTVSMTIKGKQAAKFVCLSDLRLFSALLLCLCLNVLLTIRKPEAPGPRVTLHLVSEKPISLSGLKHKYFRRSPLVRLSEPFLLRWTWWHYLSLPSGGFCSVLLVCLTEISPRRQRQTEPHVMKCVTRLNTALLQTDCQHSQSMLTSHKNTSPIRLWWMVEGWHLPKTELSDNRRWHVLES